MVPIADIVIKSVKYPEFTFVESIMGPHVKTGKQVVKAHKMKYEKLDHVQAILRMDIMIKQKDDESRQVMKDEAAQRRNTKQGGLSASEKRATAKDQREKRPRVRAIKGIKAV
jgi:hypothetical protein